MHVPMPEDKKPIITKTEFDMMKDGEIAECSKRELLMKMI